jgi:hypothetical protein
MVLMYRNLHHTLSQEKEIPNIDKKLEVLNKFFGTSVLHMYNNIFKKREDFKKVEGVS